MSFHCSIQIIPNFPCFTQFDDLVDKLTPEDKMVIYGLKYDMFGIKLGVFEVQELISAVKIKI